MLEVNKSIAKINGETGHYSESSKITNPSEKYGRNAVDNFYSYAEKPITENSFNTAPLLDFGVSPDAPEKNADKLEAFLKENDEYLKALPPLDFEYRYMPNITKKGEIDKKALISAANEDMQGKTEMGVEEMDYRFAPSTEYTSKALDINGDGKITNAEYSTSILAADMFSKSDKPDTNNIDGTINPKGMNAVLAYSKKSNAAAAAALYSSLYNKYNLEQ